MWTPVTSSPKILPLRQAAIPGPERRTKRIFKILLFFSALHLKKDHKRMPLTSPLIFVFNYRTNRERAKRPCILILVQGPKGTFISSEVSSFF